jgi:transposase-like protein
MAKPSRDLATFVGKLLEEQIPKVRLGTYFPSLLQPHRRAEQALLAVVQEASVHGVSTRKVDELMKALGLDGVSKSEVSRICSELDPVVEAFRTRALTTDSLYLWVDATYHKVRLNGRVTSQRRSWPSASPGRGNGKSSGSTSARRRTGSSVPRFCAAW